MNAINKWSVAGLDPYMLDNHLITLQLKDLEALISTYADN